MHGACERLDQIVPDGDGKRRLAHAASADDRDEACRKQLPRKQEGIIGPPDHSGQAARQIGMRKTRDALADVVASISRVGDMRDEAITASRQGGNVACTALSIAQCPAQAGDVEPQLPSSTVASGQT
jgi:hypothetical protein